MLNLENCHICNSNKTFLRKKVGKFRVLKCRQCGLKWVHNATEEVTSIYEETYFSNESKIGYNDYLKGKVGHRRNARNILKIVSRFKNLSNLKILDIGSAFGFLLDEAKKVANCEVTGVDLSAYACEYAKTQLNLNVLNTELKPGYFSHQVFDIVFMIGTIEHLTCPKKILSIIKNIIKPGGLVVITTMDTHGMIPLVSLKPPEHLFYFNHDNLSNLLKQFDFKVLDSSTYFADYYLYDLVYRFGEFFSLKPLIPFSKYLEKMLPNLYLYIPTPEMIVIAEAS